MHACEEMVGHYLLGKVAVFRLLRSLLAVKYSVMNSGLQINI